MRHRIRLLFWIVVPLFGGSNAFVELIKCFSSQGSTTDLLIYSLATLSCMSLGIMNIWDLIIKSEKADSDNGD